MSDVNTSSVDRLYTWDSTGYSSRRDWQNMGTYYYLIREDNETLYCLGKSYVWRDAFTMFRTGVNISNGFDWGQGPDIVITVKDRKLLAEGLAEACNNSQWIIHDPEYFNDVAMDIGHWAGAQIIHFVSEHEAAFEDARNDKKWPITGDRYRGDY